MGAEPIPHELLLQHAGFLRRLARDLLRDPASADDAVQEVMLRALEKPPREVSNLRAWLRTVLTNLVRTRARDDARRRARELDHGRTPGDEQPSTLRSVTDAVLALEEPLRTTVLQHYFQGLTTAEIAARENLPNSTVKSRLQRALEILRVRLKHANGETWQAALFALTWPSKLGKGVLLVSLKTKLAAAAALVLATWWFVHDRQEFPAPVTPSEDAHLTAALEQETASSPAQPALESESPALERTEHESLPAAAVAHGDPPETELTGSLRGPDGQPIRKSPRAWCSITDERGVRLVCDATQGGSFIFSGVPLGKYWMTGYAFGYRIATAPLELSVEAPKARKDLTLTPQPMFRIRVLTPDGKKLRDALELMGADDSGVKLVPIATREAPGALIEDAIGSLNNPFGIGQFWQSPPSGEQLPPEYMGVVLLNRDPPAFISLVNWHAVLQTKEIHGGEEEVTFVLRPEDVLGSAASVRLKVLDSDGQTPLAGAQVTLSNQGDEQASAPSGADGVAEIRQTVPCVGQVVVVAKDHARRTLDVRVLPGALTDLGQVALEPELVLHVQVRSASGPVAGAQFSLLRFDRTQGRYRADGGYGYSSGADGVLTLPALGRELYLLRSANLDAVNEQPSEKPKLVCTGLEVDLRSGVAPGRLELQLVPASTLALALRGESDDRCTFRVSDEEGAALVSGRFWWLTPHPLSLPPGKYRVELFDPAGQLLATKSVALGSAPLTLEIGR